VETTPASGKAQHVVRPYRPEDRETVRAICANTGFLGKPIDPAFEDRELFADYLTRYYTDIEPESTFVCEFDGQLMGYVMGSRFPAKKRRYEMWLLPSLVVRGVWRYFARPYNAASRRYVRWIVTQARQQQPYTPPDIPHLHINILPSARGVAASRVLVDTYLRYLHDCGEKQVYGQVVTYDTRRGVRMFERYGFRVIDQREVTKYRGMYPGKIHLFTILKDLTVNSKLYGVDLHRADKDDTAEQE
jgi:Acetyltransferase (GNAT) family